MQTGFKNLEICICPINKEKIMKLKRIVICIAAFIMLSALPAFSQGQIKVVVNSTTIEAGESLGATLLLNGDGSYDVYAAITGGALGSSLFMFNEQGALVTSASPLAKIRSNIDISTLSVEEKIIALLPKFDLLDTASLKGVYTFYVALCTPGNLDFTELDFIQVEIK